MESVFKVGYDLKGDKSHHQAMVTMPTFDPKGAHKYTMDEFKKERIVRALVLIDCVKLSELYPETESPRVV